MSFSATIDTKSPEPLPLAPPVSAEATELAWRGVEHCRQGEWTLGLYWSSLAAESAPRGEGLPALFYSYLGYGIARFEGNRRQGLELCRRAVELELYQPEAYYFLAETHLLMGDRRAATDVVEQGLDIDPEHRDLQALKRQLGRRRSPVLTFLPRQHRINRILGRLRHGLVAARAAG